MKKTFAVLAMLLVATVLASGCTQQPAAPATGGGDQNTNQPPQNIFQQPVTQPGSWAKVALTTTSARPVEFTYKYVEKTLGAVVYTGMETETVSGSSLVMWEKGKDANTPGTKMYSLSKFGQITLCNSLTTAPNNLPVTSDPYEKPTTGVTQLGTGTYTTPTGKSVAVTKYRTAIGGITGEYWYSGQVPFVLVWSETNMTVAGKDVTSKMELQDFGTSGAISAFTDKNFENCE
ncbi:MAG: hypothetical protein V1648_05245 [Candidatus Aenigmatarchaeota archaeon]